MKLTAKGPASAGTALRLAASQTQRRYGPAVLCVYWACWEKEPLTSVDRIPSPVSDSSSGEHPAPPPARFTVAYSSVAASLLPDTAIVACCPGRASQGSPWQ